MNLTLKKDTFPDDEKVIIRPQKLIKKLQKRKENNIDLKKKKITETIKPSINLFTKSSLHFSLRYICIKIVLKLI